MTTNDNMPDDSLTCRPFNPWLCEADHFTLLSRQSSWISSSRIWSGVLLWSGTTVRSPYWSRYRYHHWGDGWPDLTWNDSQHADTFEG